MDPPVTSMNCQLRFLTRTQEVTTLQTAYFSLVGYSTPSLSSFTTGPSDLSSHETLVHTLSDIVYDGSSIHFTDVL